MAGLFDDIGETVEQSQYGRVPIARASRSDPSSSHAAAGLMNDSGAAMAHAEIVMALVRDNPGLTAVELHGIDGSGLDRVEIGRRLDSLVKVGRVRKGEVRQCRIRWTPMLTWWPEGS